MYTQFYNLKENPFNILPDPAYLYMSKRHKQAVNYLRYGFGQQAGFIVITGEIGTGKTTLIKYLIKEIKDNIKLAIIFNTKLGSVQFLQAVLQEFEVEYQSKDKIALYEALNQFIIKQYAEKNKTVLIIDEAQNLSTSVLEEVRMISNLQTEKENLIQILLVGQPGLQQTLQSPEMEQLAQRVSVNYHLGALSPQEVYAYIRHRLKISGANGHELFSPEALNKISLHSKGIPRLVNIICDTALVYGFADSLPQITEKVIENVIEDRKKEGLFADDEPPSSPVKTGHQKNVPFILHRLEEKINRMETLLQDLQKKPDEQKKQTHINDKTVENILVKAAKILNSYETELKKLQKVKDDLVSRLVVFELKMGASNKPKTGTLKAVIISGAVILSALIVYLLL